MTKGELVSAVRNYLNRPNMSSDDIGLLIGVVEGELNAELREHPRNVKRSSLAVSTADGILPLPDDVAAVMRVFDDEGRYEQYPLAAELEPYGRGYIDRGSVLEVFPHPEVGRTMYLDYHAYLDPLEGDADTNWLSRYHGGVYLYGVLKEAAVYLKDDSRLALWEQVFARRLAVLKSQGWDQNVSVSPSVRVR